MTKEKLIELSDAYDQILGKQNITAVCKKDEGNIPANRLMDPASSRLTWKADNLSHARWMCGEVKKLAEAGDIPKANRWFGFVQGILWTMGIFTVGEMRGHNA